MFQVVFSISICAVFERAHMPMLNLRATFYKLMLEYAVINGPVLVLSYCASC